MLMALAAAAAPSLLAYNKSPSPTFLNQALALGLWASFVLVCVPRHTGREAWPLAAALGVAAVAALGSWGPGALPSSLAVSALGMLAAAAVFAWAGAAARTAPGSDGLVAAFAAGWVVSGLLNLLVAGVQVFAPALADGDFIASSNLPGRAVGNLRQPNHLSSLLLWSVLATVALLEMRRLGHRLAAVLVGLFVFGVVLTASRTGVISVGLLALWAVLDRRLAPRTRWLLLAAPLVYAVAWAGMAQWAEATRQAFGGVSRISEDMGSGVDYSGSRFTIWWHTLALIKDSPWLGVGFGEFNFAWTLTAFPTRPKAFFDHTHNLPLQVAVELGLPLAAAVMALLLLGLWRAARRGWTAASGDAGGAAARAGVAMVVMIGLHSLLEYPLWYAYFLLPTAWVWGFALGPGAARAAVTGMPDASSPSAAAGARTAGAARRPRAVAPAALALNLGAVAVLVGAALAVADYTRVTAIFSSADGAAPLAQRIEAGRRSVFFSHHADYAAVTSGLPMQDAAASFANTTHYLLDGRLMIAWAEWHEAEGRPDHARHLAARLREFRSPDAEEFFAACPERPLPAAEAVGQPFQCQSAARAPHWREFLRR
ncbi:MAG: O-antigen ligase C-terminal domain-containing protein [Rubrivivax sp.]|nr:O-antigen ligase C-terminal domain-containing protein [Rubrivivax sp.]